MKRLFRIGSGMLIISIIPILSWIVLGIVLKDDKISNVFSLTYAIQFISAIIKSLFASGANIKNEKDNDKNAIWNGIFWGTIFSLVIFALPIVFINQYITFFGQDAGFYKIYVIYGIANLFLQTLFSFIIEKLYFEDKEKTANIHLLAFNLTSFSVITISNLIIKNPLVAIIITLFILLVYVICLYAWQFEKFKIQFKFFKNFKYESSNIISNIFMFVIYTFGFRTAFSAGQEYLIAINLIGLCTDTQWDMMEAVSTIAKVDISKNRFEYKKEVKNAQTYAIIIALSSILMSVIVSIFKPVEWNIAIIYLAIQVITQLIHPYKSILSIFTQLEYSPTLNTIISFSNKVLRTTLSLVIISPYCTDIAQFICAFFLFTIFTTIRISKYKVVDGKLVVKSKRSSNEI